MNCLVLRPIFKTNWIKVCCYCTENVRVRFAPSPTGFLHLGGLRTALYNFLYVKSKSGKFILRIEDTDQSRIVPGAVEQLQKDLEWSGIQIDEGPTHGGSFGPYIQSQRLNIYEDYVKLLLQNNSAYYCFCTEKRLELLRKEALKSRQVPKYDNKCRSLTLEESTKRINSGQSYCIRFKLKPGVETFTDLIYGDISYDITLNEGDPVIIKTDGYPTYHFANVVDDHCMNISHVLRGVEWQISTTKHILMYKAFNWTPPTFGHLPLLINQDGTKLSKRQGDIRIESYRNGGIFPLALINFIVNSGGGFQKDSEQYQKLKCYTIEELTEQFDISRINLHSGRLMPELLFEFNRLDLKRKLKNPDDEKQLIEELKILINSLKNKDLSLQINDEHIKNILKWSTNRITKLSDLISDDLKFIWTYPKFYKLNDKDLLQIQLFINILNDQSIMERDVLNPLFKKFCIDNGIKFGSFMKTLRLVLSGLKEGPGVAEMMEILGRDSTIKRLELSVNNKIN